MVREWESNRYIRGGKTRRNDERLGTLRGHVKELIDVGYSPQRQAIMIT